ncbi:hypothetical protein JOB18_014461 [Solea senegalensis]|uniref:Secreted protein n=1 Tax=Solea senegalensis TaxID=28829 RepID=A0AAV6PWL7_SOLSE|nr:hypothetical protein JOB18_014461 [Solea senegalensis]
MERVVAAAAAAVETAAAAVVTASPDCDAAGRGSGSLRPRRAVNVTRRQAFVQHMPLEEGGRVPMLQIPAFDLDTKGRPAANAPRHEVRNKRNSARCRPSVPLWEKLSSSSGQRGEVCLARLQLHTDLTAASLPGNYSRD